VNHHDFFRVVTRLFHGLFHAHAIIIQVKSTHVIDIDSSLAHFTMFLAPSRHPLARRAFFARPPCSVVGSSAPTFFRCSVQQSWETCRSDPWPVRQF
jgi:hypothetical protein